MRQLFLDDVQIERLDGLRRTLHQPTKYAGNPILRYGQTPWQGFRCQLYGTCLFDPDDKLFKLWYLAVPGLPFEQPVVVDGRRRVPNFQMVGYAESRNGFDFELPRLRLVDFNGSTANNLCRIGRECVEGIAVVLDRSEADRQRRYKALYWEHIVPLPDHPGAPIDGMCVSFSADGKRWTDHPDNPVMSYSSDTGQQALYDPRLQKYVAYGRLGVHGRRVARAESADFVRWSDPQLVLEADAADSARDQVYGLGVTLYEGLYLGLPWLFHEGTSHKVDVQLAVSRDGSTWNRVADRATFIPNGPPGAWDEGIVFTASQPVVVRDDTLFIYYSGSAHDHNYARRPAAGTPEWEPYWDSIKTSIGIAALRRDGFVSLSPTDVQGRLITRPFPMPAVNRLHVNIDAHGGEARVRLVALSETDRGASLDSAPIVVDDTKHEVRWSQPTEIPSTGTPVRLEFTLVRARLFSYWFE